MLILCNSGLRVGYAENFLNLMFMPKGAVHELRYSEMGDFPYIDTHLVDDLDKKVGMDALIVFIDRFGVEGYVYYPSRFAKLQAIRREGVRAVITVEVGDYADHHDPSKFTAVMGLAHPGLRLPAAKANRLARDDGLYAFMSALSASNLGVMRGKDAWHRCVKKLSVLNAFNRGEDSDVIFAKSSILVEGESRMLPPLSRIPGVRIRKDRAFRIRVEFYYPRQLEDESAVVFIDASAGAGVQLLSGSTYKIGTHDGSLDVVCVCDESSDRKSIPIAFAFRNDALEDLLAPEGTVSIYVVESLRRALLGASAIGAYVIGTALLKDTGGGDILGGNAPYLGVLLQASSLFAMFALTGKKLV